MLMVVVKMLMVITVGFKDVKSVTLSQGQRRL